MTNIHYDEKWGLDLPSDIQLKRMRRIMAEELTPRQRQVLEAYYLEGMHPAHIARRYGIHRSTVSRTLERARKRLRRYLTY